MRHLLTGTTILLLVVVAACNQTENTASAPEGEATTNQVNQSSVHSGDRTPEQIAALMEERHENFEDMGDAFKAISRELKGDAPNVAVIRQSAGVITGFSRDLPGWFPAGSGPETGRETRAKAEIWREGEAFRARHEALAAAAGRFNILAQGGDIEAIRAESRTLGKACAECHDRFRAPEDE